FEGVRCTLDSFAVDAFVNLEQPTAADVSADNAHYVGRLTRIGMGIEDDKGRCITTGVTRILDATVTARRLRLTPDSRCVLKLLVTRLPSGDVVPPDECATLPGFTASIGWYRFGRPVGGEAPQPASDERSTSDGCCRR